MFEGFALSMIDTGEAVIRVRHDCGHYLAEEAPEATYSELAAFFGA